MAVTSKDTAALSGSKPAEPTGAKTPEPAEKSQQPEQPFMSEGIRQDLELYGKAVDPMTGGLFERDKTGKVTYTDRAGKKSTV